MYVDLVVLFLIYAFSVVSLGVSLYAMWSLKDVEVNIRNCYKQLEKQRRSINETKKESRPKSIWG